MFPYRYTPSQEDVKQFNLLKSLPATGVHVQRWYRHIASFSAEERKAWPQTGVVAKAVVVVPAAQEAPKAAPAKPAAKPDDGKFIIIYIPALRPQHTNNLCLCLCYFLDDDDVDLFGSDDEEESAEAARIREERVAAYAAKKGKKPALIAKSSVLLDVKPWDDETDMKLMEQKVRSIEMDGLLWGAAKLVPVGYGIHKLQIMCVIEDDKVSTDLLSENIEAFEDVVQSVDIAAFNKI